MYFSSADRCNMLASAAAAALVAMVGSDFNFVYFKAHHIYRFDCNGPASALQ